jgi:hypothetical protein
MKSFKQFLNKPTHSVETLAKKHKLPVAAINKQLKKGIKVEREHSKHDEVAKEIALDHIAELPDYYDRLDKMEKK